MAAYEQLDSGTAYSFSVSIDGIEVPKVMDVGGLKAEVDKISHNQQTSDGKFITRNLIGREKAGEFTLTRGATENSAGTDWLSTVIQGDISAARKTAVVELRRYDGEVVRRMNYENCWVRSVELGNLKAGATEVLTEKWTVCYDTVRFE